MKLNKFFEDQERLDQKVIEVHKLQGVNLTGDVTQALYTELGELSNEIGFFKYWKINKKDDKERQYDEWADGFHFLLSLGNKYGHSENLGELNVSRALVQAQDAFVKEEPVFHQLFDNIYKADLSDYVDYMMALGSFIIIGHLIGMDTKDMEMAYITKNHVNYERLANGY